MSVEIKESVPTNIWLEVDDVLCDYVPYELASGEHLIRVISQNYQPWRLLLKKPGRPDQIVLQGLYSRTWSELELETKQGASVSIELTR